MKNCAALDFLLSAVSVYDRNYRCRRLCPAHPHVRPYARIFHSGHGNGAGVCLDRKFHRFRCDRYDQRPYRKSEDMLWRDRDRADRCSGISVQCSKFSDLRHFNVYARTGECRRHGSGTHIDTYVLRAAGLRKDICQNIHGCAPGIHTAGSGLWVYL